MGILKLLRAIPLQYKLLTVVVAALMSLLVTEHWLRVRAERAALQHEFRADSAIAAADTGKSIRVRALTDSLRAYTKRAVQVQMLADSIDRELRAQSRARIAAVVTLERFRANAQSLVTVLPDSTRIMEFTAKDAAYKASVQVTVQRDTATAIISVQPTPFEIGVRVLCGEKVDRVRTASVVLTHPPWARVQLGEVQQDASVCNAAADAKAHGLSTIEAVGIGAGVTAAVAGLLSLIF